jgi:oxygen-independent coproporphyrinogen-3 oxidase
LLAAIRMRLPLVPEAEVTLEANPGTVEAERFAAYRDAGVTRLSLGIQSFDDAKLRARYEAWMRAQAEVSRKKNEKLVELLNQS